MRRLLRSTSLLLLVAFLDEFASGMPVAGAGDIVDSLGISTALYALAVFAVPMVVGAAIEVPLLALSDRHPHLRPQMTALGLAGVALGLLLCGFADDVVVLTIGVTIYFPCIGLACGVAEGMIVEAAPDQAEQRMARWTLFAGIGDIATPVVLWGLALVGVGFRDTVLSAAALVACSALLVLRVENPVKPARDADEDVDDEDAVADVGLVASFRLALGDRWLLCWLGGTALCSLLDETLAALLVLLGRDRFGSASSASALLTAFAIGAGLGSWIIERLLRTRDALGLLCGASLGCAACFAGFLLTDDVIAAAAACFFVGACTAPLYPIAKAQAYRALPGRPGIVNAAGHLFLPLDIAAPLLLGVCADRFGIDAALSFLVIQPLGLAVLSAVALRRRRRRRHEPADPQTPHQLPELPPPEE